MNSNETDRAASGAKKAGISAKRIMIPAVAVILCLHAAIIGNTIRINRMGTAISYAMEGNFAYARAAKALQNSADVLADKARLYVSTGDVVYLDDYCVELRALAQQDAALKASLVPYAAGDADAQLDSAMQFAQQRAQLERRAMRLCAEAKQADLSGYPEVADTPLAAGETALPAAAKAEAATALLISPEYLRFSRQSTIHIDSAVQAVSDDAFLSIARSSASLRQCQVMQWVLMTVTIAVLAALCVLLFRLLLDPLGRCADQVEKCEVIPFGKGFSEFLRLSTAYNDLLQRRESTESFLHRQSQTDALTGLPNRLAFENFVSQLSKKNPDSSVVVFSLDVNGLKETNDQEGHASGDALLRSCAECISAAFGTGEGRQCFRFGGDEFSAFWVDVPFSELDGALERFKKDQTARDVSVSLGYACAEKLRETSVAALYEEADKKMYEDKAEFHRRQAQEVLERLKLITE